MSPKCDCTVSKIQYWVILFINHCILFMAGTAEGHWAAHRGRGLSADAVWRVTAWCWCLWQWCRERLHPADDPQPGPSLEEHLRHVHGEEDEVRDQHAHFAGIQLELIGYTICPLDHQVSVSVQEPHLAGYFWGQNSKPQVPDTLTLLEVHLDKCLLNAININIPAPPTIW